MYRHDRGFKGENVRCDEEAGNNTSPGEPFDRVDYCGVVFINRGEGCEARVTYRDEEDYPEAVDGRKRGGK